MHFYAFGSICRGDIDRLSDVDLLALTESYDERLDPAKFSIYSYTRMKELWAEGNPFAWHLHTESRLLFASDDQDFLLLLSEPQPYANVQLDCAKFQALLEASEESLASGSPSNVFELSSVFLAVRNFATCFALGKLRTKEFSRQSAWALKENPLRIDEDVIDTLQRCRVLSTRGIGELPLSTEVAKVVETLPAIREWMNGIMEELR
jgi:hypothetical protein